ncbi:hypothetical protein FH966_14765 [Lentibacillus cibarius]|uniref:Uncharacterized protein n=1 Tax=Lentibacillus cibarius TaxID=2583219 RepID=A0A549YLW8_9BACI|nr:hypothetical protein [Lentibacillus cibarius]TRM08790.1 hypothetical protein FH966_16580 [Lentibacillus cibarius]TRM12864.1 hypothetical protein FH966_14765 [Lentibacillus cibarius]
MGIVGDALSWLGDVISDAVDWLLEGIRGFFQTIIDVIVGFFEVIFAIIQGLLYVIYMIGVLAVKLFHVIFEAAKMLWSLVEGFARTLASLNYDTQATAGHGYSELIGKIFDKLQPLQIEPIAYVLLFMLWFITAISAIKLISSIRIGGD